MTKKTFDAVAFMRRRHEELSCAYTGLSADQIKERIQRAMKDDPGEQALTGSKKETGNYHDILWKCSA